MKVICTAKGKQAIDRPNVEIGSTYTVVDYTYGWEMMHPKTSDIFYQLAEMDEDQRFWSGLFSEVLDMKETIDERNENYLLKSSPQ